MLQKEISAFSCSDAAAIGVPRNEIRAKERSHLRAGTTTQIESQSGRSKKTVRILFGDRRRSQARENRPETPHTPAPTLLLMSTGPAHRHQRYDGIADRCESHSNALWLNGPTSATTTSDIPSTFRPTPEFPLLEHTFSEIPLLEFTEMPFPIGIGHIQSVKEQVFANW